MSRKSSRVTREGGAPGARRRIRRGPGIGSRHFTGATQSKPPKAAHTFPVRAHAALPTNPPRWEQGLVQTWDCGGIQGRKAQPHRGGSSRDRVSSRADAGRENRWLREVRVRWKRDATQFFSKIRRAAIARRRLAPLAICPTEIRADSINTPTASCPKSHSSQTALGYPGIPACHEGQVLGTVHTPRASHGDTVEEPNGIKP